MSLALFCVGAEAFTRFGFAHVSRTETRLLHDHAAALAVRKGDPPSVLLVGNSLLLEGIDRARLQVWLSAKANVVEFAVEETQYLDWFYGLQRLFSEGSQPDMVVLCLSAEYLISSEIRGDYSGYYLFRLRDIFKIRRDAGYDLTQTTSLALSRFSLFYTKRSTLRNFVLLRTAPAFAQFLQGLAPSPAQLPSDGEIERIASNRLAAMRELCLSHGAQFAFLLPPGFGRGQAALVEAGTRSGTDVMVPIHLNALSPGEFQDHLHLNASGARIFTDRVGALLKDRLEKHPN